MASRSASLNAASPPAFFCDAEITTSAEAILSDKGAILGEALPSDLAAMINSFFFCSICSCSCFFCCSTILSTSDGAADPDLLTTFSRSDAACNKSFFFLSICSIKNARCAMIASLPVGVESKEAGRGVMPLELEGRGDASRRACFSASFAANNFFCASNNIILAFSAASSCGSLGTLSRMIPALSIPARSALSKRCWLHTPPAAERFCGNSGRGMPSFWQIRLHLWLLMNAEMPSFPMFPIPNPLPSIEWICGSV
mmetsp:Transcript_30505/g.49265  ORF Transcript_30505/g.49265 Transcript_30505/m.49265 type:complete len:256 (+) Transcript_30505:663-1430(+)